LLRTDTVLLKPTPEQEKELFRLAEQSSLLWNRANYERRQALFKHKKTPGYAKQCYTLKTSQHFRAIGTGKAQPLLKKLAESWQSFWELKEKLAQGRLPRIKKVSPPRYWKDRKTEQTEIRMFCVRNDCYRIKDNTIVLAKDLKVQYAADRIRNGKYGRLDVIYDSLSNRWYAHIPVKVRRRTRPHQPTKKHGSIDLGICNIATMYVPNKKPLIYSGRAVLSDWVYHTKKIAQLQSQLKQKQYTSKRIQKLFRKRQRRFRHATNSLLRDLFERAAKMSITHLIVGDLNGIRNGNNLGRRTNQKLHNFWSHASILKRIKELGEEFGIRIRLVSEAYTSATCCICGQQHNGRIYRGLHVCSQVHKSINADVSGAYNIYEKVAVNRTLFKGRETSGSRLMAQPLMLRWEYHQWH
jgi:putative transposase